MTSRFRLSSIRNDIHMDDPGSSYAAGERADTRISAATAQGSVRYLSVGVHGRRFAIPLDQVIGVVESAELTPIPFSPPPFEGLVQAMGQVVPQISLAALSGLAIGQRRHSCRDVRRRRQHRAAGRACLRDAANRPRKGDPRRSGGTRGGANGAGSFRRRSNEMRRAEHRTTDRW